MFASKKILFMSFRATNDSLHKKEAPITLDFLIPSGTHIDEKMTIGDVIKIRFKGPKSKANQFFQKISEIIPFKYRFLGTTVLYLFWTLLFLVFFRIFTWMRYVVALSISFFAGALVYFFMPDLVMSVIDDVAFLVWAIVFWGIFWWSSRRKKMRGFYTEK
jgi:hypothetical protein